MNDMLASTPGLLFAGAAGALLGLLFFGGLWWTLRLAFASPRTALWIGGSLLVRMATVAAGFVVVSAGDWRRLLSCLLGFWAARWLVVRLTARHGLRPRSKHCSGGSMTTVAIRPRAPRTRIDQPCASDPIN